MLITRTPFRISFFGGGTDYKEYYERYGGSVISTTVDKYCYVTMRKFPPFFPFKNQLSYSKIEKFNSPDEIEHPLVRASLRYIPVDCIQIGYDADLPARSGMGTSSAFAVGLVEGLHAMRGEYPDRMTIAREAIHLERDMCREAGGVQDQIAAAFGGFNRIFFDNDGFRVRPVRADAARIGALQKNLLLVFTGFTHFSGEVAAAQVKNIPARLSQLHRMSELTDAAEEILGRGDLDDFGRLLNETWRLKKELSDRITNSGIDSIYEKALASGALGGKLLGAGGGGFLLLYVPLVERERVLCELSGLMTVPFRFENEGTKIIYVEDK